eukprot:scaffold3005_cov302-Prasinococcus_capsulatus_cf.AAC.5
MTKRWAGRLLGTGRPARVLQGRLPPLPRSTASRQRPRQPSPCLSPDPVLAALASGPRKTTVSEAAVVVPQGLSRRGASARRDPWRGARGAGSRGRQRLVTARCRSR